MGFLMLVIITFLGGCLSSPWDRAHPNNFYINSNPIDNRRNDNPIVHLQQNQHGIHVVDWDWAKVRNFFTFTAFIIVTGLAKVAFHHAHWLSSRIPESCLMIVLGIIVGGILHLCGESTGDNDAQYVLNIQIDALPTFTPRLFFFILLPPVILESAYSLYDRSFVDNLSTILVYAVIGTLLNTFLIGPLLYGLAVIGAMGTISLNLATVIVFAALISAVDPVAVLAIFQEVGVNKDLYYMLFGESLLNDAVTVVLYTTTVTFTTMHHIDGVQFGLALVAFFTVSLGGLVIGIFFGLLTALLTKTTEDVRVVEPLAVLGIAYLSYLSAELFHFSGIISIIGCGLVQAHYALKNISDNSRITVVYFTKMISSTSDAIIFLFLGIVLVSKRHMWHTGFVFWTLVLCLVCRFVGVFSMTAIINRYRVKKINFQEQFIMAYGGLRGAVAFSLAKMLIEEDVKDKPLFLTTTLIVILFTVFVQGGTIKLFVNCLNIEKSKSDEKTLIQEINENIIGTMMAGIEEITGVRGDNYVRRKIEYYDQHYLTKIFLNTTKSNSLTRLYEKLALTQHFAHLYGPVTLVEDRKAVILHEEENAPKKKLPRSMSARTPQRPSLKLTELFPGVQLRRRTLSDTTRPDQTQLEVENERTSTEQLRKAFRSNPYQKFHERYDPSLPYDELDLSNMLQRRVLTARRITHEAAMTNRFSITPSAEDNLLPEFFEKPLRKIHSELEGVYPEELEGIDAIFERARRRVARQSSNTDSYTEPQSPGSPGLGVPRYETHMLRRATSFAPKSPRFVPTSRSRKTSNVLNPYPEMPEHHALLPRSDRVNNSGNNTASSEQNGATDHTSKL